MGFSLPTWTSILKLVKSTSLCAHHCLIQFEVVHRAPISTVKLSQMYPDVSPNCDKCQTAEASLIHMYWSCPRLSIQTNMGKPTKKQSQPADDKSYESDTGDRMGAS
ncbi:hypothetical protein F7725_024495 [Dissostichus mawsoni]|uniref:Uncharacterized protein n=1 Tax=Dissostichus mawsoni TaxID=36200 RepID=A0A7J5XZH4_DISMA|nr:hypothetical protein F7725_024495 [Dissostichus mawsoni]